MDSAIFLEEIFKIKNSNTKIKIKVKKNFKFECLLSTEKEKSYEIIPINGSLLFLKPISQNRSYILFLKNGPTIFMRIFEEDPYKKFSLELFLRTVLFKFVIAA